MKIFYSALLYLLPLVVFSQPGRNYDSPLLYKWMEVGSGVSGEAHDISMALSPSGLLYVGWGDHTFGDKIYVRRFNGTDWVWVGAEVSPGAAGSTRLAFDQSGTLYVAFCDEINNSKVTVKKFNGSLWENVGAPGFSDFQASDISLAISPSGQLYVSYNDDDFWGDSRNCLMVKKFDGTNWMDVGSLGNYSNYYAGAKFTCLAFDTGGYPHVAFQDNLVSGKATVLKFDGTKWAPVGTHGFSSTAAWNVNLVFSPSGEPYVAFQDQDGKAQVMKFSGSVWENVGLAGFAQIQDVSLAFNPVNHQPYLAFGDNSHYGGPSVMRFDGSTWAYVGTPNFSFGGSFDEKLVFSSSGVPYVAFLDDYFDEATTVMKYDSVASGIEQLNRFQVTVYPNPVLKELFIDFKVGDGFKKQIDIYDLQGTKMLGTETYGNRISLNAEGFPSGIYMIKVRTGDLVYIGKFCKM